ncbi:MAG: hypothetical protein WDO19_32405 [Bacteroidota bacterium]
MPLIATKLFAMVERLSLKILNDVIVESNLLSMSAFVMAGLIPFAPRLSSPERYDVKPASRRESPNFHS